VPRKTEPPAPLPTTGRSAEVITAAAELFDARGYHATSMEDIAEAVGIRKPTLYHYVKSKDEILYRIFIGTIGTLLERVERRRSLPMSPEQQLLEIMSDILEIIDSHNGYVRVFFEHHRELPPDRHDEIMALREEYHEHTVAVLRAGIDAGTLRSEVDPQLAALALFGACNWAYQWYDASGPLRGRDIAYSFWDMFLNGMTASGATPPLPVPGAGTVGAG
jgi:AcrR family transcriptional regulator